MRYSYCDSQAQKDLHTSKIWICTVPILAQIFVFKNVDLVVDIPREYPLTPLSVVVPDDQNIPTECIVNINSAITEWLRTHVSGSLMLRPFLHWLDRVITMLVKDSIPKDIDSDTSEDGKADDLDEELELRTEDRHEKLPASDKHEELQTSDGLEMSRLDLVTKRGTEVRLKDLMLSQNVATSIFSNVKLVVECTRCKSNQDIAVTAEK